MVIDSTNHTTSPQITTPRLEEGTVESSDDVTANLPIFEARLCVECCPKVWKQFGLPTHWW